MTLLDGHGLSFLNIKMSLSRSYVISLNKFKMKRFYPSLPSKVIMVVNLKMKTFKSFAKIMVSTITFLLPGHCRKMVLLRERIGIYRKWLER